jgi:hypothetical protein
MNPSASLAETSTSPQAIYHFNQVFESLGKQLWSLEQESIWVSILLFGCCGVVPESLYLPDIPEMQHCAT